MGGNNNWQRQKKSSSSSSPFSLFSFFSSRSSRSRRAAEESRENEYVKAYKVYPSDEDRGHWVAEPGIDKKASAYISLTTNKWGNLDVAN